VGRAIDKSNIFFVESQIKNGLKTELHVVNKYIYENPITNVISWILQVGVTKAGELYERAFKQI